MSVADQKREVDEQATAAGVSMRNFAHLDQKKILRKMDVRIVPILALLYLMSFLDRSNIANAKVEGLSESLNMSSGQYNWTLTIFFFSYCAFDLPSNIVLKKLRPSIWLPITVLAWGIVMTLMGLVQSYKGLLTARFFLGLTEAGLYPGASFYITTWYCRGEALWRQSLFFSAASIAGAFSGLLAFAIAKMDGIGGLEVWRWIFILEGLGTVLVALLSYFVIWDYPQTATFLTAEERAFVVHRLKYQISDLNTAPDLDSSGRLVVPQNDDAIRWTHVRAAILDWQIWVNIVVYWGIACPLYGIALFLPTIIQTEMDVSPSTAQLLTIPIYVSAAASSVLFAFLSDRRGQRSPFLLFFFLAMAVGFVTCVSSARPGVVYAGVYIAACAIYPAFLANVTWLSNNLAGTSKRAAGMGIQIGFGSLGGAIASNFYRDRDAPRYVLGHALELGFILAGATAAAVLMLSYSVLNRRRQTAVTRGAHFDYTSRQLSEMGDRAVTFRYFL
ncbi:high-affinity nicotinic acid transporter [Diplodia corticola]|uniref:High-affinity nicotinic acid transporter n=1 Tax=Diplodia corticola TaxID=236234 RepID=A0A1J9RIA9_9PEZI|nr:high-affinity nicotinic acid transporter [Diplodia corticola]OJD32291.1 high-affinity nicotinic acid transporter [Diplodia corticola]